MYKKTKTSSSLIQHLCSTISTQSQNSQIKQTYKLSWICEHLNFRYTNNNQISGVIFNMPVIITLSDKKFYILVNNQYQCSIKKSKSVIALYEMLIFCLAACSSKIILSPKVTKTELVDNFQFTNEDIEYWRNLEYSDLIKHNLNES